MELHPSLREQVRLLGELLGQIMEADRGSDFLNCVERIRQLSKWIQQGDDDARQRLADELSAMDDEALYFVGRAFTHFLNLANIAEQRHRVRKQRGDFDVSDPFLRDEVTPQLFRDVIASGSAAQLVHSIQTMQIDLVLTAHPTESMRRTLIQKYEKIAECLAEFDGGGLSARRASHMRRRLKRLVSECWHTNDTRSTRPTPIDEVKWAFAMIENSLWQAVPDFLRELSEHLQCETGVALPPEVTPVRFCSWIGGDRDGNPSVTHAVTHHVLALGRWAAADLYARDLSGLIEDLSMSNATEAVHAMAGAQEVEPYRCVLKQLRREVLALRADMEARLEGVVRPPESRLRRASDLFDPMHQLWESLHTLGMGDIADGYLLDTLRRISTFGLDLLRLDIRQEANRHTQVMEALVSALGLGQYSQWDEDARWSFLLQELQNPRPLIPLSWTPSEEVAEVLATCRVIADSDPAALGLYVISMAQSANDVLTVMVLQKACGVEHPIPVAPLFETLDDLERAPAVIEQLLQAPAYQEATGGVLHVMIGYSDSAKDAGTLAAAWAQYRAQEELSRLATQYGVQLVLFHGRGGTAGRGGGPSQQAILAQPPGSVVNAIRVTEQGEMIRWKFGLPDIAVQTLSTYVNAVLQATELPGRQPEPSWTACIADCAEAAVGAYRGLVRDNPEFIQYFHQVTPERALGKLPLASRPAKRRAEGGLETLRAIPWIFSWMQIRLMLPAWLGSDRSLSACIDRGGLGVLRAMYREWPFFTAYIDMLEMVVAKTDPNVSVHYEETLLGAQSPLGTDIRVRLAEMGETILAIKGLPQLLGANGDIARALSVREPYLEPLHVIQAELLRRDRQAPETPSIERALMVSIVGIAAGMRNTG